MRTITINIKYNVGDRVWIMQSNYPVCVKITRVRIYGGEINEIGESRDFGSVTYFLSQFGYQEFTEDQLCDTFEELRDRVFSDAMRENIEQDKEEKEDDV